MIIQPGFTKIEGFVKIHDPKSGEIFVDKKNAINYENMSIAIADTLSNRGYGAIYQMAFGNGGASVDATGIITYLPPNTTGINAALYNQTYAKIVDDNSVFNLDPTRNKMTVSHTTGKVYTDILVQCLLDYGEPAGQAAFDNSTQTDSSYIFDRPQLHRPGSGHIHVPFQANPSSYVLGQLSSPGHPHMYM